MKITLLIDNQNSWIMSYVDIAVTSLSKDHDVLLCQSADDVREGDLLFVLACTRKIPENILKRNVHNLVIHESSLPEGKGWSPMAWQILEGKKRIPIVMFEAVQEIDAGNVYYKDYIDLDGTELLNDLRLKQWDKTKELIDRFINDWPNVDAVPQEGESTYYRRRTRADDEINSEETLATLFNKLRIVDNEKYPAWFQYNGQKYLLKIYKESDHEE
jgi:methionyl-tRNA formyltransferase